MKDLMMHISQHPGILVDVMDPTNPSKKLIHAKPARESIPQISQLLADRPFLKIKTYAENKGEAAAVETKTFTISKEKETSEIEKPSPQHTVMSDPNITAQLLVLQAENKWLKSSHDRLEKENSELRVNTEKLRIENNELTIRTSIADREKQLALQQQEISNKPKGLSGLAEPSAIKEIVSGLAEAVRAFKGNDSGNNNSQNQLSGGNGLSQAKQEVVDFFISKLGDTVTDDQANKIAFLLKTMIEKDKVDHLFSLWSEPVNNNNNA